MLQCSRNFRNKVCLDSETQLCKSVELDVKLSIAVGTEYTLLALSAIDITNENLSDQNMFKTFKNPRIQRQL